MLLPEVPAYKDKSPPTRHGDILRNARAAFLDRAAGSHGEAVHDGVEAVHLVALHREPLHGPAAVPLPESFVDIQADLVYIQTKAAKPFFM